MKPILTVFILLLCTALAAQKKGDWVVAQDGSGRFRSVQDAIDAVPEGNVVPQTIFIRRGVYAEVVTIDSTRHAVRLVGEDRDATIIQCGRHSGERLPNGDTINTWTSATVFVFGNDFRAENLTIRNDAGFSAGQAVALRVEGTRAALRNCRITGFQDVLFLSGAGTRHYFESCTIEGTTDFIFGAATAVFQNCTIHSKKNSHVTAAATPASERYGFVFIDCTLTADTNVHKVSLGRPWRPHAAVTYIRCTMGAHIIPEGWDNWKNPANEATARFAEYRSSGPGARPAERARWSRQLTEEEAAQCGAGAVLGYWKPFQ
ncbi:MAG: pectin esterase [Chitinophagaceae bacterium]|nr:MAG: pectin esterase [Chitinophagaceae bacterium]